MLEHPVTPAINAHMSIVQTKDNRRDIIRHLTERDRKSAVTCGTAETQYVTLAKCDPCAHGPQFI
jgi:hypothetical protein